ncbi:MAG: hypothetical protein HY563_04630, partial [Ignavibacteriales bacterium]|nr:hypothetical protein [Ignavibacteriales bacterium]
MVPRTILAVLLACGIAQETSGQIDSRTVKLRVGETLESLLYDEDTDNDKKITIDDPRLSGTSRGDKRFWIPDVQGGLFEVTGTYALSNLLQELSLLRTAGADTASISAKVIFEPPTQRISRFIREHFWDGLTRRVDEQSLPVILSDEKTVSSDGHRYLYVPSSD